MNKVRIISKGSGETTQIYIDGVEMTNVTHISFYCGVQQEMQATITARMYVDTLEVNGELNLVRQKDVARMSDEECLERALMLIESGTGDDMREVLLRALSQRLRLVRG